MKILLSSEKGFLKSGKTIFGGVESFTGLLIPFLVKAKHQYIAFSFTRPKDKKEGIKIKVERKNGNQIIRVKMWVPTKEILALLKGKQSPETEEIVDKLTALLKELKPDVFFLNGFVTLFYIIMVAVSRAGIPIVAAHHGIWSKETDAIQKMTKLFSPAALRVRKNLEAQVVRLSKKDIFLNKMSLKEYSRLVAPVPAKQQALISLPYNPLYLNAKLPPAKKVNPDKMIRIGMVGRWDAIKNFPAYIALAKEAKRQGLPWEFCAVTGFVPSPWLDEYRPDFDKYITRLDPMTPAKLKKFYQTLDMLVMPSHFETFGGVAMEAMLQNKPVLLSPTVGWSEKLREHGLINWIISFDDPKKVITRIRSVVQEHPPKALISDIIKYNHHEYIFKQYMKIFKEVGKAK